MTELVAYPPFALRVSLTDKVSLTDPAPQVNRASCLLCGHLLTACPDHMILIHPLAVPQHRCRWRARQSTTEHSAQVGTGQEWGAGGSGRAQKAALAKDAPDQPKGNRGQIGLQGVESEDYSGCAPSCFAGPVTAFFSERDPGRQYRD